MTNFWVLERCSAERFPFRLRIISGERTVLALRAQAQWPAAGQNIFCLRETEPADDVIEEVERVPVVAFQRRGVRLSVVLDRPRYKRCDFLFLTRESKGRPGEKYEQIFWQTQLSMRQKRPAVRLVSQGRPRDFAVRIAHDERYPWRFPGSVTERGVLPAGDYALLDDDGGIRALVERKTFENLLADFGTMPVLHQRLIELAAHENHALVVEAPYESFLDSGRVHHYSPSFCAAAIAEMYALYPRLRLVFCANRKTANEWTRNYFAALSRQDGDAGQ